jgi:peroxiredoxin
MTVAQKAADKTAENAAEQQTAATRAREGQRVPDVELRVLRAQGEGAGQWQPVRSGAFFGGRTVVLFALPGAFTPTCSSQHLPRYEELAAALTQAGVDEIACLAVNDPFVMQAWAHDEDVHEVTLLADGNCEFTEALGMAVDKRDLGFGRRSWRYSMLVRDGVIERLFAESETPGDPYRVSDADTMLAHVAPGSRPPDRIALLTREGCPHCARARKLLDDANLDYVEVPLEHAIRGTVVGAITGRDTVPQVFINGEHIGGADDLERKLFGRGGDPEPRTAS